MAKITTYTDLNEGTEYTNSLAGSTVQLSVAGNLSNDGVTGQALFSAEEAEWKAGTNNNKYRFPFFNTVGELAQLFEMRGGWTAADATTLTLIRDSGLRYRSGYDSDSTVTQEWCCLVQSGTFEESGSDAYYLRPSDGTTKVDFNFSDEFNELVKIYDSGGSDDRASLKVYKRSEGYTYAYYDLVLSQELSTILPVSYLVPMSTEADSNWGTTDANVAADAPYTGIVCYTSLTGTVFDAASAKSYVLNEVGQDGAGRWFICSGAGTLDASGVADYTANGGSGTFVTYTGEREIPSGGGVYYAYNKIISGTTATQQQIWEKHQYQLRQTGDIDAHVSVSSIGNITTSLLSWEGGITVTATGVMVDNYQASEQSNYRFTDVGGTRRSIPSSNTAATSGIVANSYLQVSNETAAASSSWASTTVYSVGDRRLRTTGRGTESTGGLYLRCTTAGTSAGSEPTWSTTPGATTADGTAVWTTMSILVEDGLQASDWSLSYTEGEEFFSGDTYDYRVMRQSTTTYYKPVDGTGIAGATGFTILLAQESWDDVEDWAWDSSTITKYTLDGTNIDIDITGSGTGAKTELVSWWASQLMTSAGMFNFWAAYVVESSASVKQDVSVVDVVIEKTSAGNFQFTDNDVRYYRSDFSTPYDTTGNSIFMDYSGVPLIKTTGGTSLTAAESAAVLQIPGLVTDVGSPVGTDIATDIANVQTDTTAILADTSDMQPKLGTPAVDVSADIAALPTAAENADKLLLRSIASGSDAGRLVQDALRANRNRVVVDADAGTIIVYQEDDTTIAWQGTIATGERDPINSVDPA